MGSLPFSLIFIQDFCFNFVQIASSHYRWMYSSSLHLYFYMFFLISNQVAGTQGLKIKQPTKQP